MLRSLLLPLAAVSLTGCAGLLAYNNDGQITVGALDDDNIHRVSNEYDLIRQTSRYDDIAYALDAGGQYAGVCRSDLRRDTDGDDEEMDFHVFKAAISTDDGPQPWGESWAVDQEEIAEEIDDFTAGGADTNYEELVDSGLTDLYFHCYGMGASGTNGRLVLEIQPHQGGSGESTPVNLNIEVDVTGSDLIITDVELWERGATPQRVIAMRNDRDGNTIQIDNGVIEINNTPVRYNGSPVNADTVDWQFQ